MSRYLTRPSEALIKAAKKIVAYLKYTRTLGLRFASCSDYDYDKGVSMVVGFSDASDADCLITRRSTGGHVLFVGPSTTLWKVGRQQIVTLSTAESELMQLGMAVQDVKHLRELLDSLGFPQMKTKIYEDNEATIQLAENPCGRSKTKHMGRRYRFICEGIKGDEVMLAYCPTDANIADIFTKPLGHDRFIYLRSILLGYEGFVPQ